MTMLAASSVYEVINKDGITYLYDQPRKTVYVNGFSVGRFLALFSGFQTITLLMFFDAVNFTQAGLYTVAYFVACFFMAYRLARLRVYGKAWWDGAGESVIAHAGMGLGLFGLQLAAHVTQGVFLIGFLVAVAYYLGGLTLLAVLFATSASSLAARIGQEIVALPRIVLPTAVLQERQARMQAEQEKVTAQPTFDAEHAALLTAWEKKNTDVIEQLLRQGDEQNRQSWEHAIASYNAARDNIDLARGRLRYLVKEADKALAGYSIDYGKLEVARSGVMHGDMSQATLPPKDLTQKLDYRRGMGVAAAKAVTGNAPWQVTAVSLVFSGVMMAVNHQKLLRQLKELEGQIKAQAAVIRGDLRLISDEIALRLMPQFDGLVRVIGRLEAELDSLRATEENRPEDTESAQAKAFQLACTFREAQYLIEMKAGN